MLAGSFNRSIYCQISNNTGAHSRSVFNGSNKFIVKHLLPYGGKWDIYFWNSTTALFKKKKRHILINMHK